MSYENKGDYGYWRDAGPGLDFQRNPIPQDRDFMVNGEALTNVIFPANPLKEYEGDIVPIGDYAGQQFAYAWWREGKDAESRMVYGRLKSKGYDFATTDKFKIVREAWYVENGRIYHGDTVLMACTAERYEKELAKEERQRRRMMGERLDEIDNEFSETVARSLHSTGIHLEPLTEKSAKASKKR